MTVTITRDDKYVTLEGVDTATRLANTIEREGYYEDEWVVSVFVRRGLDTPKSKQDLRYRSTRGSEARWRPTTCFNRSDAKTITIDTSPEHDETTAWLRAVRGMK